MTTKNTANISADGVDLTGTDMLTLARVCQAGVSNNSVVVDLLGHYSNRTEQIKRVQRVTEFKAQSLPARSEVPAPPARRVSMRLSVEEIESLLREYQLGATGGQLAERFGLARSTVIKLLKEHGVAVRRPRVSAEETALAVELYRQGVRQIDIAERLGRDKAVVWHLLRRAGAF